jgi:hypothetical protein
MPPVFAGATGVAVIERLIPPGGRPHSGRVGWLDMEISGAIADSVQVLLHSWDQVWVARDLQSVPGVVRARKPLS